MFYLVICIVIIIALSPFVINWVDFYANNKK
jgi:hypothetical protein